MTHGFWVGYAIGAVAAAIGAVAAAAIGFVAHLWHVDRVVDRAVKAERKSRS